MLRSGSVSVAPTGAPERGIRIEPDQRASLDTAGTFRIRKVRAEDYISWIHGYYRFDNTPLSDVLARLARYYNRTFDCSPEVGVMTISGKLELNDDPGEVLRSSRSRPRSGSGPPRRDSASARHKMHERNTTTIQTECLWKITTRVEKSRAVSPNTARHEMKSKNYPILNFNSLQMYNKNGNIGTPVPDNKQLSRLLRIKVLFLLAAIGLFGSVAAQTSSPDARISLNLQNVPLKEVFSRIEDQSNYIFVYYDNILDASRRVSISVSDQTVGDVLEVLFAGTENTWKLSGRQIVIGKAAAAGKAEKQTTLRVMGSVKDHSGEPLIGVTVFVKERPNIGTATDINGNYLIDVLPDDVLEFSYVGYKTQDVAVAGRGLLDVVLEQNDALLDAVEVVGYGVQKKISVIGSQQSIQVDELKVPAANLTQGLAGRVAGLVSVQRTSEPGFDDADIYIRGISTLTASMSAPLTLVDGVPRSFANVDPEDIESFSILKDASATAVYGVRGANGVIIINTKSGLKGRPKFTVRYTEGITTPTKITDFVMAPLTWRCRTKPRQRAAAVRSTAAK